MKSIIKIIACLFIFNIAQAQSDEQAIAATVNNYLEGGTLGDVGRFKSAFFPDAIQKSVGKTGVTGMSVEALASKITAGSKMDRTTKLVSWSYAGTAATAVTETEYPTSKIIDLLNLLKVNGEWKIVSRVYSRIEKEESVSSSAPSSSAVAKVDPKTGKATPAAAKPKPKKVDDGWE